MLHKARRAIRWLFVNPVCLAVQFAGAGCSFWLAYQASSTALADALVGMGVAVGAVAAILVVNPLVELGTKNPRRVIALNTTAATLLIICSGVYYLATTTWLESPGHQAAAIGGAVALAVALAAFTYNKEAAHR